MKRRNFISMLGLVPFAGMFGVKEEVNSQKLFGKIRNIAPDTLKLSREDLFKHNRTKPIEEINISDFRFFGRWREIAQTASVVIFYDTDKFKILKSRWAKAGDIYYYMQPKKTIKVNLI